MPWDDLSVFAVLYTCNFSLVQTIDIHPLLLSFPSFLWGT